MLDHDHAALTPLMNHPDSTHVGIERRMLAIHYRVAIFAFQVSSKICASRQALEQMSDVVAHFANCIREAAASPAAV